MVSGKTFSRIEFLSILMSIATFIWLMISGYFIDESGNVSKDNIKWYQITQIIFGVVGLCSLLFLLSYGFIQRAYLRVKTRRRNLNHTVIIEDRKTVIDWFDYKKNLTTFYEEIYFYKIGKKLQSHMGSIRVDSGRIISNSIQNINCSYNLNNSQDELLIHYINKAKNLNNMKSLVKRRNDYFIIKAVLQGCLKLGKDTWAISAKQYVMFADLKIIMPKELTIVKAIFFKLEDPIDANGNRVKKLIEGIEPLIINYNGREGLFLKFPDIDVNERYVLEWKTKEKK